MPQRIVRLGRIGLFITLLVAFTGSTLASTSERGQPFISWHPPQAYGAGTQNWAVTQGEDGLMYFGNDGVVLVFDGARWEQVRVAPGRAIRSLARSRDGRILVGSQGDFGYLETAEDGTIGYVSLAAELDEDAPAFTDVWQSFAYDDHWYFASRQALFHVHEGHIHIHPHEPAPAGGSFLVNGDLYSDLATGLARFDGERYHVLPGARPGMEVFAMIAMADGRIVIGTRQDGLHAYDPQAGTIEPVAPDASAFLSEQHLYHGTGLADGRAALATLRSGVVLVDIDADSFEVIDRRAGLPDVRVWHLFLDADNGLWLAMDTGIARIESGSVLSRFDRHTGLEGPVLSLARHEGILHAGTTLGLFRLMDGMFEPVAGIDSEVWDLTSWRDDDGNRHLLAATTFGIFAVEDEAAERISAPYLSTSLAGMPGPNRRLWVGTYDRGLGYLDRTEEGWTDTEFVVFDGPVRRLHPDTTSSLWVETWLDGLVRVDIEQQVAAWQYPRPETDDDSTGWTLLSSGSHYLVASREGIWQWHDDGSLHERADIARSLLAPQGGAVHLAESDPGVLWAIATDGLTQRIRVTDIGRPEQAHPLDALLGRLPDVEFYTLLPEEDGTVWVSGADALYRIEAGQDSTALAAMSVSIRSASAAGNRLALAPGDNPLTLGDDDFPLAFRFAAPAFDWPEGTRYRYRLQPLQPEWSEWQGDARQEFTHLPTGSYRFEVQARDAMGRLATTPAFTFEVPPPWYQQTWVAGSALLATVAMVPLLLWLGGHRQARHNARLEALVAERTRELQQQKRLLRQERDRFDHLSRHDELTGLPNRRHGQQQLERAWRAALDSGRYVSLALIDVDHFKRINDQLGHEAGDRVLVELADILRRSSRPDDVVVRWGGEEFLLLFPGTGLPDAVAICHRISDLIGAHDWSDSAGESSVTISAGVTATRGRRSVSELLSRADELLYQAKRNGRSRVEVERENW
jgi:diguanylate cyclase (GGDEF)-like protein